MSKSYRISENITFEFIDSNIYILNINSGEYYELSDSASMIWKEIDHGNDVDSIKNKIKSFFAKNDDIDSDIDEALRDFIDLDLIKEN